MTGLAVWQLVGQLMGAVGALAVIQLGLGILRRV